MLYSEGSLEQASNTGRALGVPNDGFDGAYPQRRIYMRFAIGGLKEGGADSFGFLSSYSVR